MKIQIIEKSWINQKCNECGKLIYPEKVVKVKPEKGKIHQLAEWRFCEKCFEKIFLKEVIADAEK